MKKFFKNEKTLKVLYTIASFLLALCIVACSLITLVKATVLDKDFLCDTLNSSTYYTDLKDEITSDLVDIGNASGLDESFFDDFVDEIMIREDVQDYIECFYNNDKLSVDTSEFEKSLRTAIKSYKKQNNINTSTDDSINYFIDEASKIYANNIEITYFSYIQDIAIDFSNYLLILDIILIVISLALIAVIIFTNKWKHQSVRFLYYSTTASGLFLLIIPIAVFASGLLDKIAILSRSLNDLYISCLTAVFTDMIIVACILLIFSALLAIVYRNLRKQAVS